MALEQVPVFSNSFPSNCSSHVRMDKGQFLKLRIDVVQLKEISRKKPEDFEVIFLQLVVAYPELTVT